MASTIADKLIYLDETKTAIRNAIVAKGVDITDDTPFREYADKIGEISGGGETSQFGISLPMLLGAVDTDGTLDKVPDNYVVDLSDVKKVGTSALAYRFYNDARITGINAPNLKTIGSSGMSNAFFGNQKIKNVSLPVLATINFNGMINCFQNTLIERFETPNLSQVDSMGLNRAFYNCERLWVVDFSHLMVLGANALAAAFVGCVGLQTVSFPALYSVANNSFGTSGQYAFTDSGVYEIHFAKAAQPQIEATDGYAEKWGATNATIYFDL